MPSTNDLRQTITTQLVEAIQAGTLPWRRPWRDDPNSPGVHSSLSTGRAYRGINQLILTATAIRNGLTSRWWGTFGQIKYQGGCVRRGERGTHIIMFKIFERDRYDRDGKPVKDTIPMMRDFVVFNASQCVGLDPFQAGYVQPQVALDDRYDAAQATLDATGATIIHGGNRACYSPATDTITLPSRWQFDRPEEYFQTAYHEAIHWSEKRLAWDRSDKENTYALGELVAEIGSCFLMGEHGLGTTDQAPPYLAHWLKAMQNDCRFIFTASAQASKAADFILSLKGQMTPTSDQVEEFAT